MFTRAVRPCLTTSRVGIASLLRSSPTCRHPHHHAKWFSSSAAASNEPCMELSDILELNRKWAEGNREQLRPLQAGQQPKYLVICCSDSRCPETMIMGLGIGECFVVRNVANQILTMDYSTATAITYGVDVLNIKNILVIGHRGCGGVAAALTSQDFGTMDPWIRNIRDVWRLHKDEIDAIEDKDERLDRLIERNVIEQCVNLYKFPVIQKKRWAALAENPGMKASPQIHGLVYNPEDGLLKKLDLNLKKNAYVYRHIYQLED